MRLTLHLTPNTEPVPFTYLHALAGAFHRCLGPNSLHDGTSLYGFSFLSGGRPRQGALTFPEGSRWTVGFHDPDAARRFLAGVMDEPHLAFGMRAFEVQDEAVPAFGSPARFRVNGCVVAREKRPDGTQAHLLWTDPGADAALTRVLRHKLTVAGFDAADVETAAMAFDRTFDRARSRLFTIKGIQYKGSECPVVVRGTPEVLAFAYTVGAGELTGSGFGALK